MCAGVLLCLCAPFPLSCIAFLRCLSSSSSSCSRAPLPPGPVLLPCLLLTWGARLGMGALRRDRPRRVLSHACPFAAQTAQHRPPRGRRRRRFPRAISRAAARGPALAARAMGARGRRAGLIRFSACARGRPRLAVRVERQKHLNLCLQVRSAWVDEQASACRNPGSHSQREVGGGAISRLGSGHPCPDQVRSRHVSAVLVLRPPMAAVAAVALHPAEQKQHLPQRWNPCAECGRTLLQFLSRDDVHRIEQYGKNLVEYPLLADIDTPMPEPMLLRADGDGGRRPRPSCPLAQGTRRSLASGGPGRCSGHSATSGIMFVPILAYNRP